MDVEEFKKDFLENIKAEAITKGEGSCASFVDNMAQYLVEAEVLPDFSPAFYSGTASRNRKLRVDGYAFDEFDNTVYLIIADFDGIDRRTIGKSVVFDHIKKLILFAEESINGDLHNKIEMSTPCSDLVDILRFYNDEIRKYRLFIFTDAEVSGSIKTLELVNINGIMTECQVWDIDRLFKVCSSDLGRQKTEIDFTHYISQGIPCLEATSAATAEYNSYLCIIPGDVLAEIYDTYGSQLLEGNVRSFLSTKVAVNKKIRETILKCPSMFFAYNNGIAATAMDVEIEKKETGNYVVGAKDFQIINGGQTTASLSNARHRDKADLSNTYVQMKLTEIDESDPDRSTELIRNISRSSNSQNKVSDADFFSTHPFHVRMEKFSRRIFAPADSGAQYETKWFYERARGQYIQAQMRMTKSEKDKFVLQNPKKKVITKTDLAKVRNTWNGYPFFVSRGAQTNFMKFAEIVDEEWANNDLIFNERYYQESVALMILFRHTESIIPKQSWYEQGYRANIVTYTIALLRDKIIKQFKDKDLDLMSIWNKQSVSNSLTEVLENLSEAVFYKITDPNRPTINVTQWCKRDACWKGIKDIGITLPESFTKTLIDKSQVKAEQKDAKMDQKIISGAEAQAKILEYTADQWQNLSGFAKQKRMLTPDLITALRYASQIPKELPSAYQSQKLLILLERALSEGFKLEIK